MAYKFRSNLVPKPIHEHRQQQVIRLDLGTVLPQIGPMLMVGQNPARASRQETAAPVPLAIGGEFGYVSM